MTFFLRGSGTKGRKLEVDISQIIELLELGMLIDFNYNAVEMSFSSRFRSSPLACARVSLLWSIILRSMVEIRESVSAVVFSIPATCKIEVVN